MRNFLQIYNKQKRKKNEMQLFLVATDEYLGWDTYDSFVICCENEYVARNSHPQNGQYKWWTTKNMVHNKSWVPPEKVEELKVVFLGEAADSIKKGIICSSFHAG